MATKKNVARAKSQAKLAVKAPADTEANTTPSVVDRIVATPYRLTGAAFDGGEELRSDCTPADLFILMFEAPNRGRQGLLADALRCAADDFALLTAASSSDMASEQVLERFAMRAEWRIKVVLEMDERIKAAAKTLAVQP